MPILSAQDLKQAVVDGVIGAISIDTSIYEQNQYGFETGVLAQMSQFDDGHIKHLVADTVLHEVRAHLSEHSELVKAQIKNALKPVGNSWGIDKTTREDAIAKLFGELSGSEKTEERINAFLESSAAIVLESSSIVKLSDVLDRYFKTRAPFGDRDAKKREFPDAIALLALEGWSQQNGAGVLVVSRDGDWKLFCEDSKVVYFVDSLPQALSALHINSDDAAQRFRTAVEQSQIGDLDAQLLDALNAQADKIEVDFEGHANWHYEDELIGIEVVATELPLSEQLSGFEVLDYSDNELQLQTTLRVGIAAQFSVSFNHWDSSDREYLGIGSTTVEKTEERELNAILTVRFNNGVVALEQVELLPFRTSFDLGEVEPDWMDSDSQ